MIYVLNFVDRQIINILAEPIKNELRLRDWQIGALTGLSFALAYGALAVPMARIADRHNRPKLIAGALFLWSSASIACGLTRNFSQLATARAGVAGAEAAFTPAAHSLISDCVPERRKTLAFGLFSTGVPLGSVVAMTVGGVVSALSGWRSAFFIVGLPGLLITVLFWATVSEPRDACVQGAGGRKSFTADAASLFRKRSFRLFIAGSACDAIGMYGTQAFISSFFLRMHNAQLEDVSNYIHDAFGVTLNGVGVLGPLIGIIFGITGVVSGLTSGLVTDRLLKRGARYFAVMAGIPLILSVPALVLGLFLPDIGSAFLLLAIYNALLVATDPPRIACIQGLAGAGRRATASAISLLAVVLFGNGLGPVAVGFISDSAASYGISTGAGLRIALVVGSLPMLVGGVFFLRAGRSLQDDLAFC